MLLQDEIQSLKDLVVEQTLSLENSLRKSISLCKEHNTVKEEEVKKREESILHLSQTIENQCLRILLLHQPVATDLRYIIMMFKVNQHLERMAKYICNIAKRAGLISTYSPQIQVNLIEMAEKVHSLVERSFKVLVELDEEEAEKICNDDYKINSMRRYFKEIIIESTYKEPWKSAAFFELLDLVRHLERLGDMATNVAEEVMFINSADHLHPVIAR